MFADTVQDQKSGAHVHRRNKQYAKCRLLLMLRYDQRLERSYLPEIVRPLQRDFRKDIFSIMEKSSRSVPLLLAKSEGIHEAVALPRSHFNDFIINRIM